MHVSRIATTAFRNLVDQSVELCPRFNLLFGDNGHGKTNFLEAVYLAASLSSFRTRRTREMIRWGGAEAGVKAWVESEGTERSLEVVLEEGRRVARVDEKTARASSSYLGVLSVVLFSPDDVRIPGAAAAERRGLLDRGIAMLWPGYYDVCAEYRRVVQQRNRLLKQPGARQMRAALEAYTAKLVQVGARIVLARRRYVAKLGPRCTEVYRSITDGQTAASLGYLAPAPLLGEATLPSIERALTAEAEQRTVEEHARKASLVGPHAHDLELLLDAQPLRVYGSQGQRRSVMLALRVAQVLEGYERLGRYPVLLLDDVSSELDARSTKYLFDFLGQIPCQALLSTVRVELVPLRQNTIKFQCIKGEIRVAG